MVVGVQWHLTWVAKRKTNLKILELVNSFGLMLPDTRLQLLACRLILSWVRGQNEGSTFQITVWTCGRCQRALPAPTKLRHGHGASCLAQHSPKQTPNLSCLSADKYRASTTPVVCTLLASIILYRPRVQPFPRPPCRPALTEGLHGCLLRGLLQELPGPPALSLLLEP